MKGERGRDPRERWQAILARLAARPWLTLALIAAVVTGVGVWASDIPIKSDMEDLFPDSSPSVVRARQARKILGAISELQILIGSPDRALNREVGAQLAAFLRGLPDEIERVEFRRDISFFEDNGLLFLPLKDVAELEREVTEAIAAEVASELGLGDDDFGLDDDEEGAGAVDGAGGEGGGSRLPDIEELKARYHAEGLSEYFESPDGQVIAVKGYPRFKPADAAKTERLNALIEAEFERVLAAHPGVGLTLTMEGDYSQLTEAVGQISRDATRAALVALALIALILVLHFRRLRAIILVLLPLSVGLVLTLGFAKLAVGYFNLITVMLFGILLGLGIDFAVHAVSRLDEVFRGDTTIERAVPIALAGLGRAMLAAALTTTFTFLALMVFDFRGFSQLGLIAGAGVLLALLAVYLVLPALAPALNRLAPRRPGPPLPVERSSGARGVPASRRARVVAMALVLSLSAGAVAGAIVAPDLIFEADMRKLRPKGKHKSSALKTKYRKEAEKRTASPALIITEDLAATKRLHRFLDAHLSEHPMLSEIASVFTFVPEHQAEKIAYIKEAKRRIDAKYGILEGQAKEDADALLRYLEPSPFGATDLPEWVKVKFTDTEGNFGRYVLLYAHGSKANAEDVLKIQADIGEIVLPAGAEGPARTYFSTASYFILGDAYTIVKHEGPLAVALASFVVFLFLIWDLRRPREIITALVPLLLSFAIFMGALVVARVPLNLYNIVVLPTIFGIGVDTSIHLVHRLDEGRGGLWDALKHTGAAAGISSLTTAIGFGSLLVVDNEGLQSIGWVAVLGILITYVTTLCLVAAFVILGFKRLPPAAPATR